MKNNILIFALLLFVIFQLQIGCANNNKSEQKAKKLGKWEKIAPYFSPPDEYNNKFGNFRSPLKFYNGQTVQKPEEWVKRRIEILDQWHGIMGHWPELISDQQIEYLESEKRENFTQHRISFYWIPGEKTEGYLLIPDGKEKKPAVITVYYEPETAIGKGNPYRDFAYQLAKRGFVTLSLGTTEATKEKTFSLYFPSIENAEVQPLSMLAYAAANAWNVLSKVEGVDSTRIGIMGHSFGGKWAMFASCLYEKFACSVWSDPGVVFDESRIAVNYWEPWYLGYHHKPWRKRGLITEENPARGIYPELIKNGYDLTDLHALMSPRPFLVSGGSEDPPERWEALNHSIAVNKLLGFNNRVAMTNRAEHSPNEESNEQINLFFQYFLQSDFN